MALNPPASSQARSPLSAFQEILENTILLTTVSLPYCPPTGKRILPHTTFTYLPVSTQFLFSKETLSDLQISLEPTHQSVIT